MNVAQTECGRTPSGTSASGWIFDFNDVSQNYVGETVTSQREKIHFACPKPEDLADLMEGMVAAHMRMGADPIRHPRLPSAGRTEHTEIN